MIKNRKTVKGKLGKTRPKDTDFAGIARKQSRTKKTTTKSNRPTDSRTATLRKVLKEKQKLAGKGLGQAGQAFLGGSAKQTPVSPKKKATATKPKPKAKPKKSKAFGVSKFGFTKFKAGGKAKLMGGGMTKGTKYKAAGGRTMKTSKYRAGGGIKGTKYKRRGGKVK